MIMAVLEGVAMCFVLLIICVVGWSSFMKKKYRIKL